MTTYTHLDSSFTTRRGLPLFVSAALTICAPAFTAAGTPTPFAPAASGALVIYEHATLIDGTGAPPQPDMDVLVDGERIQRIFPARERDPSLAQSAKSIDLRGRYLIPGLIDSHVHLETPPNRRQAEALIRRDLYGGVTAVRDMADDLRALADVTRASRVGEIAGSDIYYAALMAGPAFFTDKRTIQVTAGDVPGKVPWMQAVTEETDVTVAVATARGTYARALKLYAFLSPSLVSRLVTEAHRQNLLVWSHATLYPTKPSELVAAGVDAISHACELIHETQEAPRRPVLPGSVPLDQFRDGNSAVLARLFAEMVRRGTILDATVWVNRGRNLPVGALASSNLVCDELVAGAITGQAYRAGVSISAGTDDVSTETDSWPELFHEMEDLAVRAGMPMAQVLRSATLIGARAAGQDLDMGSIEVGKLANMVVMGRDPSAEVRNLRSVVMTVKRGRIYRREAFKPLRKGDVIDF
jgi:imidazolonepropionase-like amidohydrolase